MSGIKIVILTEAELPVALKCLHNGNLSSKCNLEPSGINVNLRTRHLTRSAQRTNLPTIPWLPVIRGDTGRRCRTRRLGTLSGRRRTVPVLLPSATTLCLLDGAPDALANVRRSGRTWPNLPECTTSTGSPLSSSVTSNRRGSLVLMARQLIGYEP